MKTVQEQQKESKRQSAVKLTEKKVALRGLVKAVGR